MPDRLEDWKVYDESISEFQTVSGVGRTTAIELYKDGYTSIEDLRKASQEELSQVNSIGNALAARIKADVGDAPGGAHIFAPADEIEPLSEEDIEDIKKLYPSIVSRMGETDDGGAAFDGPISEYTER